MSHRVAALIVIPLLLAAPAALARPKPPKARKAQAAWAKLEAAAPNRLVAKRIDGRSALQVRVRPGDRPTRSGERTEMVYDQAATRGYEGRTVTYTWSTRFPAGFGFLQGSTWNIFTQFHQTDPDGCSPNLGLQINAKKSPPVLRLQTRGGALDTATCTPESSPSWDFAPLEYDRWHDFSLRVRWSADPSAGFVELTVNGQPLVTRKTTATLYRGQGVYFKQGFYRGPSGFESLLYHTPVSVAASRTP